MFTFVMHDFDLLLWGGGGVGLRLRRAGVGEDGEGMF